MTWLLFSYSGHDDGFLCDFDNSVFLPCYLILLRYVSQLSQPPMYFFYVVLFYKDISQLPLLCYSILQRYFSTTSTAFYISQLPQPHFYFTKIFLNYLFYVILFYKDISQPPQPPPSTPWFVMLTWFAMLGVITWPTLPPGLLECVRAASGIIPIACISKYVIERTRAKCKLYQR